MSYIFYDIETVKNERADSYFATKQYEPAANLKDPAKIEASIAEKRAKDLEKAPLHWWTGKVVCIGAIHGDECLTFSGEDEAVNLAKFFDWALDIDCPLIGKSGDYFDMPFIVGRCLANDMGIPGFLRPGRSIQDVDQIFSFSSHCDQRSNLANYAFGLGIQGKTGHGSDVAAMYEAKEWEKLETYCIRDVEIVAEMMKRWLKPYRKGA